MSSNKRPSRPVRLLPEGVVNMIAAGEVVERPASVVKELMENSLDAGSTLIEVEVLAGGRDRIRVSDDGCGMGRDDALLSLERHATSKIVGPEDLDRILTLGFRGEALASVAGVSRLTLETWDGSEPSGTRIEVHGGVVRSVTDSSPKQGTRIEVRSLFFNVPARRKFMRRVATELAHVQEMVQRLALAHRSVRFRLQAESRLILDSPAGLDLLERIRSLHGAQAAQGLVEVQGERGPLRLHGAIGLPTAHRATRRHMLLYLNGRSIRDRLVTGAIYSPYRGLIPEGRHPAAFLLLELPPDAVDVNVHPTKVEVRFHQPGAVRGAVAALIAEGLRSHLAETPFRFEKDRSGDPGQPALRSAGGEVTPAPAPSVSADLAREAGRLVLEHLHRREEPGLPMASAGSGPAPGATGELLPPESPRTIGQLGGTYLLLEDRQGLLMVDQHTAHERLLYERLGQSTGEKASRQLLLAPEVLELAPTEQAALLEAREELERLGYSIEPFGGSSVLISAVPAARLGSDASALLRDVAEDLSQDRDGSRLARDVERVRATVACRAAVKAGDALRQEAARVLAGEIFSGRWPLTCPHGRPIVVRLDLREIARMFGRE